MAKLYNIARMLSATTGTGPVTLGTAKAGYLTFVQAGVSDGDVVSYGIKDGPNTEIGRGTYTASGTVLERTTVLRSTNNNNPLDLSGSGVEVYISALAEDIVSFPPSTTAGNLASFSGSTGRDLQDSGIAITSLLFPPQGRLSLTSGLALTQNDVAGATSIYYTPAGGLNVPLWDGAKTVMVSIGSELSLALDNNSAHTGYHQSGKTFDLFVYNDNGTMRLATGPAWSTDASRGTGAGTTEAEIKNGFYTNKNAITLRYGLNSGDTVTAAANTALLVGSARLTANGVAEDSRQRRLLSNLYNCTVRAVLGPLAFSGNQYNYSSTTWRQAAGEAGNKIEVMQCMAGQAYEVTLEAYVTSSTAAARAATVGFGIDTTAGPSNSVFGQILCSNVFIGYPSAKHHAAFNLGYHYIAWLEQGAGADIQTWIPANRRMIGWCVN